jgi:hypothetical protein
VSEAVPAIFREKPNYIITTGGCGIHMRTRDADELIRIVTTPPDK